MAKIFGHFNKDNVFTAMLEPIVINPTYIGSRKKEIWTRLRSKVR